MTADGEIWLDCDAGPVVRAYALTQGRTRPAGAELGLIDLVAATGAGGETEHGLGPEYRKLLRLCQTPIAVVDLASAIDLSLGVVRVLLGDLCQQGLVRVVRRSGRSTPDEGVLRSVLDGLRAL